MGLLRDIERMPEMYDYSRLFFERFYRPEYTVLVLAGDVEPAAVRAAVEEHWGGWPRGGYVAAIPAEPAPVAARRVHVPWKTRTLPYLAVAQHAPAFSTSNKDSAALDLIGFLGFSESSPLYERLIIDEQVADMLWAGNADHVDPYLFTILARLKDPAARDRVQQSILETLAGFAETSIDTSRFLDVKSHLRARFALSLDDCEAAASMLAHFVSLTGDPSSLNARYRLYDALTPEDLCAAARRIFDECGRTVLTLEEESA
jgi:zinc protease